MSCKKIVILLFTAIVLLACFVEQGVSIKCWVCRSDADPKCADPFDNSTLPITDCSHERELEHLPGVLPTMCRKTRQTVNGVTRILRTCAYLGEPGIEGEEKSCKTKMNEHNISLEYCTCNSDGCNSF